MKRSLARIGAAAAAIALAGTLAACSSNSNNSNNSNNGANPPASQSAADDGAKPGEDAGFEELPLGDDVFVGPLKVGGVYFQPVDMEPAVSTPAKDSSMHMEADISAVADNDLGYGAGDFIPALIADKSGTVVQEGTFMPMNASDGPHYGINLPKLEAGTYDVTFTIKSPETNGWLLHTDEKTGVKGRFWQEPLKAEFKDWQWDPTSVDW